MPADPMLMLMERLKGGKADGQQASAPMPSRQERLDRVARLRASLEDPQQVAAPTELRGYREEMGAPQPPAAQFYQENPTSPMRLLAKALAPSGASGPSATSGPQASPDPGYLKYLSDYGIKDSPEALSKYKQTPGYQGAL